MRRYSVIVKAVVTLDDSWASAEELLKMTEQEIIDLVQEDIYLFSDTATCTVED